MAPAMKDILGTSEGTRSRGSSCSSRTATVADSLLEEQVLLSTEVLGVEYRGLILAVPRYATGNLTDREAAERLNTPKLGDKLRTALATCPPSRLQAPIQEAGSRVPQRCQGLPTLLSTAPPASKPTIGRGAPGLENMGCDQRARRAQDKFGLPIGPPPGLSLPDLVATPAENRLLKAPPGLEAEDRLMAPPGLEACRRSQVNHLNLSVPEGLERQEKLWFLEAGSRLRSLPHLLGTRPPAEAFAKTTPSLQNQQVRAGRMAQPCPPGLLRA